MSPMSARKMRKIGTSIFLMAQARLSIWYTSQLFLGLDLYFGYCTFSLTQILALFTFPFDCMENQGGN